MSSSPYTLATLWGFEERIHPAVYILEDMAFLDADVVSESIVSNKGRPLF